MKHAAVPAAALMIAFGAVALAGDVESGLEPGAQAGAFNVKDITGPEKGKTLCYR